jgi:cell division protein FtsQ
LLGLKHKTKNYNRKRHSTKRQSSAKISGTAFKMAIWVALMMSVSLGFILIHDIIIQSDFFRAEHLIVTGMRRLSDDQILDQADIRFGSNILAINLSVSRKRLLTHPWIAEATVTREIPDKISISIAEHKPLAIVDLGRKFLISDKRILFKEKEASDPDSLPLIRGLRYSDINIPGKKRLFNKQKKRTPDNPGGSAGIHRHTEMKPLDAVMEILHLGLKKGSIMPNDRIKQIRVDKDIGLILFPVDIIREIRLGYQEYPSKYRVLREVLKYIKQGKKSHLADLDVIDLNNVNRVVLVPVKTKKPAKDREEV